MKNIYLFVPNTSLIVGASLVGLGLCMLNGHFIMFGLTYNQLTKRRVDFLEKGKTTEYDKYQYIFKKNSYIFNFFMLYSYTFTVNSKVAYRQ